MGLVRKKNIQKILDDLSIDISIKEIEEKHSGTYKYYHTIDNHINFLVDKIFELYENGEINNKEKNILLVAAVFHDIVYDIGRRDNEKNSAKLLKERANGNQNTINIICEIILDTITHEPSSKLSEIFSDLDMYAISSHSFKKLLATERLIFLEAQQYDFNLYKKNRMSFLKGVLNTKYGKPNKKNIEKLIEYIENYTTEDGEYAIVDGMKYLKTYNEKIINN